MKRKDFAITYGDHRVVKHAWNSAIRETEAITRQLAQDNATTYRLTDSTSEKGADGRHVRGVRVWESDKGDVVRFVIEEG